MVITSFAFVLGVAPVDAGYWRRLRDAAARLGTAVFSGMLGVTLFGLRANAGVLFDRRLAGWHAPVCRAKADRPHAGQWAVEATPVAAPLAQA